MEQDLKPVYVAAPAAITFPAQRERSRSIMQKLFSMEVWIRTLAGLPCSGIGLGLLSGLFFATAGFIVKLVKVNPIEIVISRSLVQLVIYLPVVMINKMDICGMKGERVALFLRGISGFFSFGLLYVAYRMIPLADASTIVFSAPVFVVIFAWLLLKEECGLFQTFILIVTLVGVALISRPSFLFGEREASDAFPMRVEGTIVAVIASLFTAMNFIVIRKLPKTDPAVIINAFSVIAITIGIISLVVIRNVFPQQAGFMAEQVYLPTTVHDLGYLVANGICGVLGQFCLTVALKVEEAGLVSLARTVDIVMAFVFQIIGLPEEEVDWTSILGAVIVCAAVSLSAFKKWLSQRPAKFETLWCILNCGSKDREALSQSY